ncbi:hypothetical protein GCM10022252_76170 [Streptosporangium oxazolinicum]|uniref:Uncharacterized protein n=1 Tax=Streptosporangium oxazolinicum TaxID=909287 RepID=A0ABP8BL15_9ACTN
MNTTYLVPELAAAGFPQGSNSDPDRWWARITVADLVEVDVDQETDRATVARLMNNPAPDDEITPTEWTADFDETVPAGLVAGFALLARHFPEGTDAQEFLATLTAAFAPADAEIVTPEVIAEQIEDLTGQLNTALRHEDGIDDPAAVLRHLTASAQREITTLHLLEDNADNTDGKHAVVTASHVSHAGTCMSAFAEILEAAAVSAQAAQDETAAQATTSSQRHGLGTPLGDLLPDGRHATRPANGVFKAIIAAPGSARTGQPAA